MKLLTYKENLNSIAELGWHEEKTTEYLETQISEKPIKRGFASGLTGLLYKIGEGKRSILLRADIDGLKTSKGIAHICGHSTHMAALIVALEYSQSIKQQLSNDDKSIYFLFQPAEETFPSGAKAFIKECSDVVQKIQSSYAIHVRPNLPIGTIGLQSGAVWAYGDYMEIEVSGKMVHIKNNHDGVDSLVAASHIVLGVEAIQKDHPACRIGIGILQGGLQPNAVAGSALLKGDLRFKNYSQKKRIKQKLELLLQKVEQRTGTHIELRYYDGTPAVLNSKKTTNTLYNYLRKRRDLLFTYKTSGLFSFGCEDFAYITERIPSTIALIGTGDKYDLHEENCTISDQGTVNAAKYFKAVIDWFLQS